MKTSMKNIKEKPIPAEHNTDAAFLEGSVSSLVFRNVVPAMLGTLMMLIYNLADTFFIGQTHNDFMVAAVSLATPVFLIFMALGTLFGVGGASMISRALGRGDKDYACRVSSFCTWASIGIGVIYTVILLLFINPILKALGTSADTFAYTKTYLVIVSIGGTFSILSGCLSNILRAEGKPTVAMWGNLIGNILNIILDPVLIFGFHLGIAGAAITTTFGNIVGAMIYLSNVLNKKFTLSVSPKYFTVKDGICSGVLAIGIPASLMHLLMSLSQIFTNTMVASYGDMAVAAYGISAKIRMCFSTLGNGMGHGIQPVLGYLYGSEEKQRFNDTLRFSTIFSLILFTIFTIPCLIFTEPIVNLFLTSVDALSYGIQFTRITLISGFFMGMFCVLLSTLQAVGAAGFAMIAALSRQGFVYFPVLFILNAIAGLHGIVAAQPVSEIISLVILIFMVSAIKKKNNNQKSAFRFRRIEDLKK